MNIEQEIYFNLSIMQIISRDYAQTLESGRGSGVLGSAPTLSAGSARCVYLVVGQLVRLVGGEGSLRLALLNIHLFLSLI